MSRLLSAPELDRALALLERMRTLRAASVELPISSPKRWKNSLEFVRLSHEFDRLVHRPNS